MTRRFATLCQKFQEMPLLNGDEHWQPLAAWPLESEQLCKYVDQHISALPRLPKQHYAQPLLEKMGDVVSRLEALFTSRLNARETTVAALSDTFLYADSLIGAAVAWNGPAGQLEAVRQFAAVVAHLFDSFVTKCSNPVRHSLGLTSKSPPLVTFATQPTRGPATLNAEVVKQFCDVDLSIVSQPIGYADHPLLWGVLAHETGGHAVTHAIPQLAEELAERLPKVVDPSTRTLWRHWAEETAADVYGLLNIGPSYVLALAAWLKMSRSPPGFATGIAFVAGKPADTHPPDLLRLHVLKGATEALDEFHSQLDWIREIGSIVSGVEQEVSYLDLYFGDPLTPYRFDQAGLCALQRDAEKIGNALVTMPLERLHHKRISDIETWGSNDEEGVEKVRRAALKGPKGGALRGLGVDNAHLMAGGILALCDGASVKETNAMLRDAFSESFRKVSYYA